MTEAERKAYANKLAMIQEEKRVALERSHHNLAWRIAREFDVLVVTRSGEIWLIDCKRSDNGIFDIDNSDVEKLLEQAVEWRKRQPNAIVVCRFEMWFSRTRQANNKRDIIVTEDDRGWSIQCTKTPKKITTRRVKRGSQEEVEHDGETLEESGETNAIEFLEDYLHGHTGKETEVIS